MNKKEILQTVIVLIITTFLVVISSWFSKKEPSIELPKEFVRPVVECPKDSDSYLKTKANKNLVLVSGHSTYGGKDGHFVNEKVVSVKRTGLNSQVACGHLFYRVSVGSRPIEQKYENLAMKPVGSQFGGHIIPDNKLTISNENVGNKTEILIPLDSITYDGTARVNIRQADWASLFNVSDRIDFSVALNTTDSRGKIDSIEFAYKCWNPKTGEETDDCKLSIE